MTTAKIMRCGAGGLITGIDQANDGTKVCRADVFGAYIYDASAPNPGNAGGTGTWKQLITTTSMASSSALINTPLQSDGVFEIRIAPQNSNVIYMAYLGYVFVSTNKGVTFTQTALTQKQLQANVGQFRVYQYKMAIDPSNTDVVYLTSRNEGAFVTANGTGAGTWAAVTGVPSNDFNENGCVAFDTSSLVIGGKTGRILISVSGSGLYQSTDAGATFAHVTGSPNQILGLSVHVDGTVWVTTQDLHLWRWMSGTWTDITLPGGITANANAAVLHPTDKDRLVVFTFGAGQSETTTGTSTTPVWSANNINFTMAATDVPYLAQFHNVFVTNGQLSPIWDRSDTTKIWMSANQGIWYVPVPIAISPTPVAYTSVSAGIEELVTNRVLVPPGNNPIFIVEDVGILQSTNPDKYVTDHAWDTAVFLNWGSWADYASNNSNFICAIVNGETREGSGYSNSAGAAGTWNLFPTTPNRSLRGGAIAAASSTNMVWQQSNEGDIYYTTDGGTTWNLASFTGVNQQATTATTLSSSASSAATSITVGSVANIPVNSFVELNNDGNRYKVTGIVGTVLTLGSGLLVSYASGVAVHPHRTYTAGHAIGTTSFDLTNVNGLVVNGGFTDAANNAYIITSIVGKTVSIAGPGLLAAVLQDAEFICKTGWDGAYFYDRCIVAADRVNIGTFYLQNAGFGSGSGFGFGTWKSTDGGATWTRQTNTIDPGANSKLKAVPGNAGHLFFSGGPSGSGGIGGSVASDFPHVYPFWYSSDGGATWTDVSNLSGNTFTIREVWDFGFGAIAPGKSYPTIYIYGFVALGASPAPPGSVPGLWQSIDKGLTWRQIAGQFPCGIPDSLRNLDADPNIYGRVYLGFTGSGFEYVDVLNVLGPNAPGINMKGGF